MAKGLGGVHRTKKCACDNPSWDIVHKRKITSGKQLGKIAYTLSCLNCRSQWETTAKYAEQLDADK